MNFSANELNVSGGSSTHLNASYGVAGSAAASPALNLSNRSVLRELNSNESNSMLSPLSSKAALNNTKFVTSPRTNSSTVSSQIATTPKASAATAAGTACTVFDQELNTGVFDNHRHHQEQGEQDQNLHSTKDQLNNSGVNNSSNKFVGLTEFDETKIPELPGDLNPNIEEQYNVTFEECFIPTLNAQQATKAPDNFVADKATLLLTTELDAISSDNEIFADCNDERDPLATTISEPTTTFDTTADLESYQSAINNSINGQLDNTLENIADITKEAEAQSLQKADQTQVVEDSKKENEQHFETMEEVEPMDVDMSATMDIIQNTSENIEHVEKVLQHAENILQHIGDKNPFEDTNTENVTGLLDKPMETSKMSFVVNTPAESVPNKTEHLEMEQSNHALSLNKSIELPVNKSKSLSSECIIETVKEESGECMKNNESEISKTDSLKNNSLIVDGMNSSTTSNSSTKSAGSANKSDMKLNLTLGMSTSSTSQKSLSPRSPSFPTKSTQNDGFPRSPKSMVDKPKQQSPFIEKSYYFENRQVETTEKPNNNLNGTNVGTSSAPINFVNPSAAVSNSLENNKRFTFSVDTSMPTSTQKLDTNTTEYQVPSSNTDKRKTFSIDPLSERESADDKRRTFSVHTHESPNTQFPSMDKPDNSILNDTVNVPHKIITESDKKSRRTFNVPQERLPSEQTEQIATDTSYEPMDIDESLSQNSTLPMTDNAEHKSQSTPTPTMQQRSSSSPLSANQHRSQSPPLPTMQQKSMSPPLSTMQPKSQSPPIPTMQQRQSPPLPTMQQRSKSPILPVMQPRSQSPPLPTMHQNNIKQEQISPSYESSNTSFSPPHSKPLSSFIQKRPPIRDARARAAEILSAKERTNINVKDEKDVFVEKFTPSPIEDTFTAVSTTSTALSNSSGFSEFDQTPSYSSSTLSNGDHQTQQLQQFDDEFKGNNNLILNPSDFDYLLTKGNNNTPVDRSSLLLKFDPLLGVPVPVNQGQQQQQQQLQQLQIPTNTINPCLSPTLEEDEHNESNRSFIIDVKPTGDLSSLATTKAEETAIGIAGGERGVLTGVSAKLLKERSQEVKQQLQLEQQIQQNKRQIGQGVYKNNAIMSVDVIKDMSLNNDCNKSFENSNSTQSDDKQINYKMDELEKKIKNEVLKTEDIEKKLKDAEQREEALIKRITEKDKTVAKMTGVIEAYEKAIAELIAEKEQLIQNYEKQLAEVKADRDSNYHHLTSLETTFSDLHVKYEKSKEMTCQLKASEEALQAEKRKNLENLHLQEQRYDKMKNHAMQQLEIANKKLESLTRDHSIEITKLKALLKKEEIARSSINEQLTQKTKENAELVKICDELISGQGS